MENPFQQTDRKPPRQGDNSSLGGSVLPETKTDLKKAPGPSEILFGPTDKIGSGSYTEESQSRKKLSAETILSISDRLLDSDLVNRLFRSQELLADEDFDTIFHDIETLEKNCSFNEKNSAAQRLLSIFSNYADPDSEEMFYVASPIEQILRRFSDQEKNFFIKGSIDSFFFNLNQMHPETTDDKRALLEKMLSTEVLEYGGPDDGFLCLGAPIYSYRDTPISSTAELSDTEVDDLFSCVEISAYGLFGTVKINLEIARSAYGVRNLPKTLQKYEGMGNDFYDDEAWGFVSEIAPGIAAQYVLSGRIRRSFDMDDPAAEDSALEKIIARYYTDPDHAKEHTELYKQMLSLHMREFVERSFNISLAEIPIYAQIQLLDFMTKKDTAELDAIKAFFHQGRDEKATHGKLLSFLSLEQNGSEMGEKIITIGKQFPPDISDIIFKKYAEITSSVGQIETALHSLSKTALDQAAMRQIEESLIEKATTLLIDSYEVLKRINGQTESIIEFRSLNHRATEDSPHYDVESETQKMISRETERLVHGLDTIHADTELFKSIVKTLRENGELESLSELRGIEPSSMTGPEIPGSLQSEMLALYDENYSSEKGYSEDFRQKLFRGLEEAFYNPQATFHTITKDGKLVAYLRLEDTGETENSRQKIYFGSFNVAPGFRGAKIGETFLEELLRQRSASAIIEASADPAVPVSSHYLERDGFVATAIKPLAGRPLLKIELDAEKNAKLLSKRFRGFSHELIKELADKGASPRNYLSFRKFSSPSELSIPDDWFMTRYFQEKDGSFYAIFEQDPDRRNTWQEEMKKAA